MDNTITTPLMDLVSRLKDQSEKMSFSALKAFTQSPRHYMAYKMRERTTTPAMVFGSMVHCLILEEEAFDDRYLVAVKPDLRTKKGKTYWSKIQEKASANGLEVVSQDDKDAAERIRDFCYQDPGISWVLNQITQTEVHINWDHGGWKWRGYVDGLGDDLFCDLKILNPLDPKKIGWRIRGDKLPFQGALYQMSKQCKGKDFYILAVDQAAHGMAIQIDAKSLQAQVDEIDYYIGKFNQAVFQDAWDESHGFWAGPDRIFNWNNL